jgi:hypothetical protein
MLPDKRIRKAVLTAEQYADGAVGKADLRKAQREVFEASCKASTGKSAQADLMLLDFATSAVRVACEDDEALRNCLLHAVTFTLEAINNELAFDPCLLIRDNFGNPFQTYSFKGCLSEDSISLAQAIYDDRSFDRLPNLASRLQDRGCHNLDILNHCGDPGPHARGCWVIDLILEKK